MRPGQNDSVAIEDLLSGLARIVDGGSSNSTMKWVLLWSLFDAAPLLTDNDRPGNAISLGPVARSARRALRPQLRDFADRGVLTQVNRADTRPGLFQKDVSESEAAWILAQWPVPRLQFVGGVVNEVLWRVPVPWELRITDPRTRNKAIPRVMFETDHRGFPQVDALPDVADHLVRLAPLLKPAIETRWRDEIRARNRNLLAPLDPDLQLDNFLFPDSRRGWPTGFKEALLGLQDGRCFWCQQATREMVLDHVIPWSQTRNDAVENLVITHSKCNEVKSDLPLSKGLREHWYVHLGASEGDLKALATTTSLTSDLELTLAWARSAQRQLGDDCPKFDVIGLQPVRVGS